MSTMTLSDGKYTLVRRDNGSMEAFRYGEKWRDLTGDNLVSALADRIDDLQSQLDAHLREREAAKVGVTDALDYVPGELDKTAPDRIWLQIDTSASSNDREEPWPGCDDVTWQDESVGGLEIQYVRADLVAPMLASARVPDGWKLVPTEPTEEMVVAGDNSGFRAYTGTWVIIPDSCWKAMLAAAPKPEASERHHWLCCGALKPDHSDKPRVMPDCFDPERHVWAVSPKPETEE